MRGKPEGTSATGLKLRKGSARKKGGEREKVLEGIDMRATEVSESCRPCARCGG